MCIKDLRIMAGLTQVELAEKMGVNQTAVSQWERGSSFPRADQLPKLADALHCTVDALYGRTG